MRMRRGVAFAFMMQIGTITAAAMTMVAIGRTRAMMRRSSAVKRERLELALELGTELEIELELG